MARALSAFQTSEKLLTLPHRVERYSSVKTVLWVARHLFCKSRAIEQEHLCWENGSQRSVRWVSVTNFIDKPCNQHSNGPLCTYSVQFSSVQSLSRVWLFAIPSIATRQASLSITNSGIHSDTHTSSQWCHPAISSSVVPFSSCPNPSQHQSFPMSQLHMRWPKYLSFSFRIIPSKEIPGLISFRMECFVSL